MKISLQKTTLFVGMLLALFGCGDKQEGNVSAAANPELGKTTASQECVACHGLDGRGLTSEIPNLAAQSEDYLVAALNAYKVEQRHHAALRDMTANMSDADIRNVAAYYAGLPPLKTAASSELLDIHEKGKAEARVCASCHGVGGNSSTSGIPSLAGQQPVYFISAVKKYLNGERKMSSKEKEAMVSALNQADIEAMALYFASQKPAQRSTPKLGNVAAGEPLSADCGACHGAHGVSTDSTVPTLASQDPQYLISAVRAYQEDSRHQKDMHEVLEKSSLSDIQNIAAFYAVQASRPAEEKVFSVKALADKCERCHAPGMDNPSMILPKIRGQNREYLIKALKAYQGSERGSSAMHKMSLPYSEAVIESIATWYANQPAS